MVSATTQATAPAPKMLSTNCVCNRALQTRVVLVEQFSSLLGLCTGSALGLVSPSSDYDFVRAFHKSLIEARRSCFWKIKLPESKEFQSHALDMVFVSWRPFSV